VILLDIIIYYIESIYNQNDILYMIPFKVKKLTKTARVPTQENAGDLWDLYVDDFCAEHLRDTQIKLEEIIGNKCYLEPQGRILIKTGIAIELPKDCRYLYTNEQRPEDTLQVDDWSFTNTGRYYDGDDLCDDIKPIPKTHGFPLHLESKLIKKYAVADIRSRSGLCLKHGIRVANGVGTIDNSYRQEIGVIIENFGHEPYMIKKGDKIAQMLIRSLEPSQLEVVDEISSTDRGGFGSTGK